MLLSVSDANCLLGQTVYNYGGFRILESPFGLVMSGKMPVYIQPTPPGDIKNLKPYLHPK